MARHEEHRLAKGALAGTIAGIAGAWAMNQFQSVSSNVQQAWQRSAHQPQKAESQSSEEDDATMKTADRLAMLFTNKHLTGEQKKKAGPVVHYAFGALIGSVYGVLAEITPSVTRGAGSVYASAVWLGGDEIGVWKAGLAGPPTEYPAAVHANAFLSHLAYGISTDLVRRAARAVL